MTRNELLGLKVNTPDEKYMKAIKAKWDGISKPLDGFGEFEELICKIGAIQKKFIPDISKRALIIMCSDNGVVAEGVSQCGKEVTFSVATLLGQGKSSASTLAKKAEVDCVTIDIGIDDYRYIAGIENAKVRPGTGNIRLEPAMTEEEALKAIETGIGVVKRLSGEGYGLIATGEMGIGNTTTSTAMLCALLDVPPEELTGRGAGLDDEGLAKKIKTVADAVERYKREITKKDDIVNLVSELGGLDIAGLIGVFLGAAMYEIPVVIDGVISAVAALCAVRINDKCVHYMIPSHAGRELGVSRVLDVLRLNPFINGNMALGEGTGALMLIPLIDMMLDYYSQGTTFEDGNIESYMRFQ